jgi:hypothetical protein
MDPKMTKNKGRAILADTTVQPINGTFEDALRAFLKAGAPPKNLGRPKAKKTAKKKA